MVNRTPANFDLPEAAQREFPYAPQRLEVDGQSLCYLDEGRGEPVVMVHGNPTWSFYYRHLIERLRPHYRAVAFDHIGCGRSSRPSDDEYDYHFERRVHDLEALLDHLDINRRITLVLHDWGGMIGMRFATRHPDRIARLALLNTAAFPLPTTKRFPLLLHGARSPLGAFLVRGLGLFERLTSYFGCRQRLLPESTRLAYCAPYQSWRDRRAVHRFVQDIPLRPDDRGYQAIQEVAEGLGQLAQVPTLVIWGLRDFVFDRHFLAEWQRRVPQAEYEILPEAGHYVLEDESERVTQRIARFLEVHPLDSDANRQGGLSALAVDDEHRVGALR